MDSKGIDHIQLTPSLCSLLYAEGIVNPDLKPTEKKSHMAFLGANQKNILIGIDVPKELKSTDEELLNNLMQACNITMDDVALVNMKDQEMPLSAIFSQLKIKKAIFFGVPALAMDISLGEKEETILYCMDCTIVKTAPLAALHNNVNKKKALWGALKNMFDL